MDFNDYVYVLNFQWNDKSDPPGPCPNYFYKNVNGNKIYFDAEFNQLSPEQIKNEYKIDNESAKFYKRGEKGFDEILDNIIKNDIDNNLEGQDVLINEDDSIQEEGQVGSGQVQIGGVGGVKGDNSPTAFELAEKAVIKAEENLKDENDEYDSVATVLNQNMAKLKISKNKLVGLRTNMAKLKKKKEKEDAKKLVEEEEEKEKHLTGEIEGLTLELKELEINVKKKEIILKNAKKKVTMFSLTPPIGWGDYKDLMFEKHEFYAKIDVIDVEFSEKFGSSGIAMFYSKITPYMPQIYLNLKINSKSKIITSFMNLFGIKDDKILEQKLYRFDETCFKPGYKKKTRLEEILDPLVKTGGNKLIQLTYLFGKRVYCLNTYCYRFALDGPSSASVKQRQECQKCTDARRFNKINTEGYYLKIELIDKQNNIQVLKIYKKAVKEILEKKYCENNKITVDDEEKKRSVTYFDANNKTQIHVSLKNTGLSKDDFFCPIEKDQYDLLPSDVFETDHVNGNHFDNTEGNLQRLCKLCHAVKTYLSEDKGHLGIASLLNTVFTRISENTLEFSKYFIQKQQKYNALIDHIKDPEKKGIKLFPDNLKLDLGNEKTLKFLDKINEMKLNDIVKYAMDKKLLFIDAEYQSPKKYGKYGLFNPYSGNLEVDFDEGTLYHTASTTKTPYNPKPKAILEAIKEYILKYIDPDTEEIIKKQKSKKAVKKNDD